MFQTVQKVVNNLRKTSCVLLNDFPDSSPAWIRLVVRLSVDGDTAAWVFCDGSFTEIELNSDGKARLIQMEISNYLSTLRSNL